MSIHGISRVAAVQQFCRRKVAGKAFWISAAVFFAIIPAQAAPASGAAESKYGKIPLSFEPNQGQSDGQVKFIARADGYTLFLTPAETVFLLKAAAEPGAPQGSASGKPGTERGTAVRLHFVNSNSGGAMDASEKLPGTINYLIGNDAAHWHTGIPTFAKVEQRGVYPGIDVVYYGNQKQLECDFVVAPGADARAIALSFAGAKRLGIDASGNLVVTTASGDVHMRKPVSYQVDWRGERQSVAANYVLHGTSAAVIKVGKYDKSRQLVIDPILEYSTYVGGSNIDGANAIAVAPDKTAFFAGGTFSIDFPTAHPLQPNHGGPDDFSRDAFVAKISSDGSTLLYSTYLGGENTDFANGIAVDTFGQAYVVGTTFSPHFPVSPQALNGLCGGDGFCGANLNPNRNIVSNAFVTKLNTEGSGLIFSTFLGYYENVRGQAIAVDANQVVYVTGQVGPNLTPTVPIVPPNVPPPPFPITANAAQGAFGGEQDGFLTELSATGTSVLYSTYIGGVNEDIAYGVAVDGNANAYVTGLTYSPGFPTTGNAFQTLYGGAGDAFVTKINTNGGPFVYSSLLGGSGLDQGNGIAVDANGNAYVAGETSSAGLPSLRAYGGQGDGFVAKFNPSLSGPASLVFLTYLGGSLADSANAIALDSSLNIYVTGSTVSQDFPSVGAVFQPVYGGGNSDAFVTKIDPSGANIIYSSFLGGSNSDVGYGIAVDSDGSAYVAGQTCSLDFPLANPEQKSSGGNCDAFVSKVSVLNGIILNPNGLVFQSLNVGATSLPQTVKLTTGDSAVPISSITLGGPNPGDFAETTTCGSNVPSGTTCTFSVTFAPMAVGLRKANLNIVDTENGVTVTHVVALTGSTSTVQLSASSLTFASQSIGTTSAPQTITVTNVGTQPLTISAVVASTDFAESDDCAKAPLQPGTNCVIKVTYSPTASGASLGALTITDNVPGSPQVVLLNGNGLVPDFSISAQPAGGTVPAGQSATFNLTVSSISGFSGTINLLCSGLPTGGGCGGPQPSFSLAANQSVSTSVTISTVARTIVPPFGLPRSPGTPLLPVYVLAIMLLIVAMSQMLPRRRRSYALLIVLLAAPVLLLAACNGGSGVNGSSGTPAGTYTVVITASAGATSHSVPITLTVK